MNRYVTAMCYAIFCYIYVAGIIWCITNDIQFSVVMSIIIGLGYDAYAYVKYKNIN